ncbi:MAG: hypothetical protein PVJ86_00990 [Phycisphaerales bacterium]|jgi:hypothetical protein
MTKAKRLSKRQLAVIEGLVSAELGEQAVLDKYKVSKNLYNKWLADEVFAEQFDQNIVGTYRQSVLLIARHAPLAAAKLVRLTESKKEETTRKVCLDIISMCRPAERLAVTSVVAGNDPASATSAPPRLSPESAGRLLAVLADERGKESGPGRA